MTNGRLGPAVTGIGWSSDLLIIGGQVPVVEALRRLDASNAPWVVVVRHGGLYMYAFATQELWDRLIAAGSGSTLPLQEALQLREDQSSTQLNDSSQLAPIDTSWRPNETTPSVFRFVEVDATGAPVAVGGLDVQVKHLARGRQSEPPPPPMARSLPTQQEQREQQQRQQPPTVARSVARSVGSAAPVAVPAPIAPARDDEGTTPVRHPAIESEAPLVPGAPVTVIVDLQREVSPTTSGAALTIAAQAVDWSTLELGVTLVSAGIDFERGGRGKVTIRRNDSSVSARIKGQVLDTLAPGDEVDVQAQFWCGTRCSGSASRRFVVAQPGAAAVPAPPAPTVGTMQVHPRAVAPDLTIFISLFDPSSPGRMHWRMVTEPFAGLPPKLDGLIDLGQDPRTEAATMFKQFAKLERGEHMARIEGFGERLWDRAPAEFRSVYWALHDHYQRPLTIQFSSDDPHLPWELMRPYRDGEVHPPLMVRHAVARWIGRYQGWMSNRLPSGQLIAIAPKYSSTSTRLELAEATAEELVSALGAQRVAGTLAALRGLLEQPPAGTVALLFFTGHGLFDAGSAAASAIKLEGGKSLAVDEVARREVRLGERDGTLVFFNACEVGATAATLGDVGGWANAFLSRRFGAFIAPLWAVEEEHAAEVTRELMTQIVTNHQPIGAALRDLRAKHGDESPTFLSYLLYGDVTASLGAA